MRMKFIPQAQALPRQWSQPFHEPWLCQHPIQASLLCKGADLHRVHTFMDAELLVRSECRNSCDSILNRTWNTSYPAFWAMQIYKGHSAVLECWINLIFLPHSCGYLFLFAQFCEGLLLQCSELCCHLCHKCWSFPLLQLRHRPSQSWGLACQQLQSTSQDCLPSVDSRKLVNFLKAYATDVKCPKSMSL